MFIFSCRIDKLCLSCFQDSLNDALEIPKWRSKSEAFTVVLQSVPVILELNSVSRENQFPDAVIINGFN